MIHILEKTGPWPKEKKKKKMLTSLSENVLKMASTALHDEAYSHLVGYAK
jgi:hypothetical protein